MYSCTSIDHALSDIFQRWPIHKWNVHGWEETRILCRRTQERRVRRSPCVLCNVHGETETTVTVEAKGTRERERGKALSLSLPRVLSFPLPPGALLLFFFSSAVLQPPPTISSSPPPSLGRTDLLSRLCSSLSSERKREKERDRGVYERTRNKKVIGSRYKGKFLRGSLNGNSDFSMVPINPVAFSIERNNDLSYSITLSDQSVRYRDYR